jgi:hypothetical protein
MTAGSTSSISMRSRAISDIRCINRRRCAGLTPSGLAQVGGDLSAVITRESG